MSKVSPKPLKPMLETADPLSTIPETAPNITQKITTTLKKKSTILGQYLT